MTDESKWIEEAKARCAAATPGPWRKGYHDFCHGLRVWADMEPLWHVISETSSHRDRAHEDMEFIAHARTDIPRFIDALTEAQSLSLRLSEDNARLRAALAPFGALAAAFEASGESRAQHYRDEGRSPSLPLSDGHRVSISLGECRKARAALSPLPIATEEGKTR